jgi:hypothetical protein
MGRFEDRQGLRRHAQAGEKVNETLTNIGQLFTQNKL